MGKKEETAMTAPTSNAAGNFLQKNTANTDIAKLMNREGSRLAPQLLTLEAGDLIHGYVVDKTKAVLEDQNTRQPKEVDAWIVELRDGVTWKPGPEVSILGAAQLDRQIDRYVGCAVSIARGADVKHKGRNMTEYRVLVHDDLSKLKPDDRATAGTEGSKVRGPLA